MSYILSGDSGTVVFDRTGTITNESPTMSSQVTSNPIEGGGKITDHAVLDPIKFSITGIVSTAAGYATLEAMWRNRDLLTYRGAEAFNNLLIINLKRTRTPDNAAGFGFAVSFQQITITSAAFVDIQAPAMEPAGRQRAGGGVSCQVCEVHHAERAGDNGQRLCCLCVELQQQEHKPVCGDGTDKPQLCRVQQGGD